MGKTSFSGRFNIPGKIGWITMESPGFITLLYCISTLPPDGIVSLPFENKVMAGLFVRIRLSHRR
jgi:3-oxo-5-alpha-steroid 4-dehydrogenase 1